MFAFLQDLQGATGARLLFVLLHSLWQGGLCALLAGLTLHRIPASRATLRYGLTLTALLTTVLACFLTWSFLGPAWNFSGTASQSPAGTSGEPHLAVHEHGSHGESARTDASPPSSIGSTPSNSASSAPPPPRSKLWTAAVPLLLCGWLLGVVVMLSRVAASLHAARQLLRGTPVTDSALLDLVDRVRRRIGMTRAIRVLMVPHLSTPVICGILSPALVVPAAFLTGISPDQQLAIVAHELAHIRRWDFLINLVQLVIESVLFFNPAVWWLSRQIRIEREACCDAIAVSLTDAPLEYVRTLASWAERMSTRRSPRVPALTPAFAEPSDSGDGENPLVDRVRRVLAPTHTPHLRVRWGTLLGLLAFVGVTLFLLARGTDWAVAQAAKALTDAERVEVVAKARDEVKVESPIDLRNGKPVRVRAQLRTWDGKPVPVFHLSLTSQVPHSSYGLGKSLNAGGLVDEPIEGGMLSVSFVAVGYAPVLFPERRAVGGTEVDFGEVVLPAGRTARVRFVDPDGKPVRAERISTGPQKLSSRPSTNLEANEAGEVTFANIIDGTYNLTARCRGFQPIYRWEGPLPEQEVTTIVMKPARPLTGTVVDEEGKPAAGVEICAADEHVNIETSDGSHGYGNSFGFPGQRWETTDADGRFRIDQIADGARLDIVLQKDGVPRALIADVTAGQKDVVWKLDPVITIRGRITGDLDLINKDPRYRSIFFSILRGTRNQANDQVQTGNLKIEPDGRFEFSGLVRGRFSIAQSYAKFERDLTGPVDDLEIPIAPSSTGSAELRSLTLLFAHDGKSVSPGGRIIVNANSRSPSRMPFPARPRETVVEIPATGQVEFEGSELLGFGLERTSVSFKAEELGPTLVLPVVPSGVIRGTVTGADGQPAAGVRITVGVASKKPSATPAEVQTNASGEFLLNPIPLDSTANVTAALERSRTMSEPVRLDAAHPEQTITLRLPRLVSAEVQVFDDAGKPLADCPLGLEVVARNAETSTSHGFGSVARTDATGKAILTGLGEPLSAYQLFPPRKGPWLGQIYRINPQGPTQIHLQRGRILEGTVLDDAGKPVPSVSVAAMLQTEDYEPTLLTYLESEQKTGEDGKFRFSNLPDKLVRLSVPGMTLSIDQQNNLHSPGGPPVTLQGTVPEWLRARRD